MSFKDQISKQVDDLSYESNCLFSWLCAVRVLPFLGGKGKFDGFDRDAKGNKIQKHLLAIFRVLDSTYATVVAARSEGSNLIKSANSIAGIAATDAHVANATAVAAANAAVFAARCASGIASSCSNAVAAANAAIDAANQYAINFRSTLLDDLSAVKSAQYTFAHDIDVYGDIWLNFRSALCDLDCEYWADWYESLFSKGLLLDALDEREVDLRLSNVPYEIRELGAASVGHYVMALKKSDGKGLNETRVIILGEKGAGKTSLARRLIEPYAPMTSEFESTEGVDTSLWMIDGDEQNDPVNVHIWDFAGHVVTHAVHRLFLSERCFYIIVYDGRTERRNQLEYWLDHITNYGGDSKVIILVNLRDNHKPNIAENSLTAKYPFILDFYYFSLQDDLDDLLRFRSKAAQLLAKNPIWNTREIPVAYSKVKDILQNRLIENDLKQSDFISLDSLNEISRQVGIEDDSLPRLIEHLNALGICLRYENMAYYSTIILNPGWIAHGIYRLINWAKGKGAFRILLDDYEAVFGGDTRRYPKDKFQFLLFLMREYELLFEESDTGAYVVPFLLSEDQPSKLPEFLIDDSLSLEYVVESTLPPDVISRFIVRHNEDIANSGFQVWRHGAVLSNDKAIALVKEGSKGIKIDVSGEGMTSYIGVFRSTLNEIFNTYKSNKPELKYRIIISGSDAQKLQPPLLSEEVIKGYIRSGRDYFDPNTGADISLADTVRAYNINIISVNYSSTNVMNVGNITAITRHSRIISNHVEESNESEEKTLREARIICIGDSDAGKTTLIERLVTKRWKKTDGPTRGIAIRTAIVDDPEPTNLHRKLNLNYWDFGGQDIMHSMHHYFMAERCLYLIVLDGRREEKPEYWLDLVTMYGGHSPVMVVMNKIDHNDNAQINFEKIREIYGHKLMSISFHFVSCKEETGLAEFQIELLRTIRMMDCYQTVFPKAWSLVRRHLRHMRDAAGNPTNYLSIEEYENVCHMYSVNEKEAHVLLSWLHDMGVCLSYQHVHISGVVEKMKILQPEWITNGIYKIINDKRAAMRNGFVTRQMLKTILEKNDGENTQYRNIERDFILEMTRVFHYSYSVDEDEFFPMLAPTEKPRLPPEFLRAATIVYRIRFTSLLPVSVLHNVVVRLREDVQPRLTWYEGTFLSSNQLHAQLSFGVDRKVLELKIAGSHEDSARYLSRLLDEIHRALLYIDVEWTEYVVVTHENKSAELHVDRLQKMYTKGIREDYVTAFDTVMPILPILRIIMPQLVIDRLRDAADDQDVIRMILKGVRATAEDVRIMRQQMAVTNERIQEIIRSVHHNEKYAIKTYACLDANLAEILKCVGEIQEDAGYNHPEIRRAIEEVYEAVNQQSKESILTKLLALVGHTANLYGVYQLGQHLIAILTR